MMRIALLLLPLAALAACDNADPAPEPMGLQGPEPVAETPGFIPASFYGTWAVSPEDCDEPTSPGRLEIGPDELRYGDGTVRILPGGEADATRFSYEGRSSNDPGDAPPGRFEYHLEDDGATLVDDRASGMRLARCE